MPKRAFVVGVGRTLTHEIIQSAENDASHMRKLLVGERAGVELRPDDRWLVHLVVSSDELDTMTGARVGSVEHLRHNFDTWWSSTRAQEPDDLHLLIYFAGHATLAGGEADLLAVDGGWITLGDLAQRMAESEARNVTVILDCCGSGGLVDQLRAFAAMSSQRGRAVLAACAAEAEAASYGELSGFFTTVVLNGLGVDESVTGPVTAMALNAYISANWDHQIAGYAATQTPEFFGSAPNGTDIPLVRLDRRIARPGVFEGEQHANALRTTVVDGPLGDIRAERNGGGVRLLAIGEITGRLEPWLDQVSLPSTDQLLAVMSSLDGSRAWLVVSGAGATHLLGVRQRGELKRYTVDGQSEAAEARFGVGDERGTLTVTTADGSQRLFQISSLMRHGEAEERR